MAANGFSFRVTETSASIGSATPHKRKSEEREEDFTIPTEFRLFSGYCARSGTAAMDTKSLLLMQLHITVAYDLQSRASAKHQRTGL